MIQLTPDNITTIVVALITAFSAIQVARFSKRPEAKEEKAPGGSLETVQDLRRRLAKCEEERDRDRAAFYAFMVDVDKKE